jgi:multiple sugar transport system permease protein
LPFEDGKSENPSFQIRPARAFALGIKRFVPYLYILPAAVILFVFHLFPVIYAFFISLFEWGLVRGRWVGLGNYVELFSSRDFWKSLLVTVYYVLGTVPPSLVLSFAIAYMLSGRIRGRSIFRTVYFLPYITSSVAAAMVWAWIFHPTSGVMNYILGLFGISPQKWLQEPTGIFSLLIGKIGIDIPEWAGGPSLALVSIMIFTIWQSLGFDVVIFLAGLTSIPEELYEQAKLDGANRWNLIRHVTIPLLSPTIFFLLIISTIRAFQAFNQIYVMTIGDPGGPLGTTRNITMFIFQNFYAFTRVGYGASGAIVLFAIILGLTIIQLKYVGRRVHYL